MFDIAGEWRKPAVWVAARRLDFDDISAEVREQARRIRRGDVAQFDDSDVAESVEFAVA